MIAFELKNNQVFKIINNPGGYQLFVICIVNGDLYKIDINDRNKVTPISSSTKVRVVGTMNIQLNEDHWD